MYSTARVKSAIRRDPSLRILARDEHLSRDDLNDPITPFTPFSGIQVTFWLESIKLLGGSHEEANQSHTDSLVVCCAVVCSRANVSNGIRTVQGSGVKAAK